ncbi:MAG: pseudouridine synthase [Candidatus Heimdallarchaeota archaeon]|nr:pseudouridine synthase [Candidatus Heimdallarchaeota archaeon]
MSQNKDSQKPSSWILRELRMIAEYQFGSNFAEILVPEGILITRSKKTKKVREILFEDKRLATIRPTDGYFAIGLDGAQRIIEMKKSPIRRVIVQTDVAEFIAEGRNVFAKHVINADPTIRPEDEVVIVSEEDKLLAVGRAKMSAEYMLAFQRGTAVKVRYGNKKYLDKK